LFYGNSINVATLFDAITEPSGLNGEIQFNDSGLFGASSNLKYNTSTKTLSTDNILALTDITGNKLISNNSSGDEGGEILLAKPVTNTTLDGVGITIDSYQNRIRFFEQGGSARGAYIDLTQAAGGVGTNLLGAAADDFARLQANAAFNTANSATTTAQAAFNTANSATTTAQAAFNTANSATTTAGAGFTRANSAYGTANSATTTAQAAFNTANSATTTAQAGFNHANGAFSTANTKLNSTGGTISGDLIISGNLTITGNTVTHSADDFIVNDPIVLLANNNPGNALDIGFVAHYEDGSANTKHTGLVRDVSAGVWYLFEDYIPHIQENNILNVSDASFRVSTLSANIVTDVITVRGVDPLTRANSAYGQANSATTTSQAGFNHANGAFNTANSATTTAQSAFNEANTKLSLTGGTVTGNIKSNSFILPTNTTDVAFVKDDNLTAWKYADKSFSISGQESASSGIYFSPDGTRMYVIGSTGDDVNQYTLSTAWDVTTATFVRVSATIGETAPTGVFFKSDGTVMYITGSTNDTVREFSVSSAWDVSTIAFVRDFSFAAQDSVPQDIWFRADGFKMYMVGSNNDRVYEYDLATAWNVSTATFVQFFSVAAQETAPVSIDFSSDGTRMYVLGATGLDINRYTLSTPWNISTAVFYNNFYIGFQETSPSGMFIDRSNGVAYIVGSSADTVFQYDTETDGIELTGQSGLFINGSLYTNKNLVVTSNSRIDGELRVSGATTLSTTSVGGTLTATSTITLSGTTTSTTVLGTAATTGTTTIGSTTQTGSITLGQSTVSQTTNIQAGSTANGSTKTLNIGTGGLSGSITNINIGSAVSGATTTVLADGNWNFRNPITINTHAVLESTTITTASISQTTLDTFATATYRSAKYLVQMTSGSAYHMIELSLIHDGTTVHLSQYGEVKTGSSLGSFDASISSGTLSVLFTPTNAITTVKTAITLLPV
jgi:DNA-binding beta-propeller fold protein YncE